MQVNRITGEVLFKAGHKIDVKTPALTVYIDILRDKAIMYFGKTQGLGGLPVGSSGKVLVLLSGGIDSPVAAWLMMKRGCDVDYLHVAATNDTSKILALVKKLQEYSCRKTRLHIASYDEFYKKTFESESRSELVQFRRFIAMLAQKIAEKNDCLGIVTGDNLAQVASQTLENLKAAQSAAELPVYRPVLTYDKSEIIALAQKIGTFGISLQEYKDCCSLVASKNPETKSKLEKILILEEKMGIGKVVEETLEKTEVLEI
jgi:thiamine biosynthesis protein ThiI